MIALQRTLHGQRDEVLKFFDVNASKTAKNADDKLVVNSKLQKLIHLISAQFLLKHLLYRKDLLIFLNLN